MHDLRMSTNGMAWEQYIWLEKERSMDDPGT